jgi:hypothetical protein
MPLRLDNARALSTYPQQPQQTHSNHSKRNDSSRDSRLTTRLADATKPTSQNASNLGEIKSERCAAFAFADIAAEAERLAEGDPALDKEAVLDDGAPEDQHVDPAFFGIANGALAAAVPHGWTHGTQPASNWLMILAVVISS